MCVFVKNDTLAEDDHAFDSIILGYICEKSAPGHHRRGDSRLLTVTRWGARPQVDDDRCTSSWCINTLGHRFSCYPETRLLRPLLCESSNPFIPCRPQKGFFPKVIGDASGSTSARSTTTPALCRLVGADRSPCSRSPVVSIPRAFCMI